MYSIPLVLDTAKSYILICTCLHPFLKILIRQKVCIYLKFVAMKWLRENLRTEKEMYLSVTSWGLSPLGRLQQKPITIRGTYWLGIQ